MLGIENSRLRSVPEYRHHLADSLAGTLFLIVNPRGCGEHGENYNESHNSFCKKPSNMMIHRNWAVF